MSSGLSSFAILRLNDSVELNCEGIKKTNPKPATSNFSRDCSKAVSAALHLAARHKSGLLAVPSCLEVRSATAGSQLPLPFFREAFLSAGSVQAEECHPHPLGSPKAAVESLRWPGPSCRYCSVQGEKLKKRG